MMDCQQAREKINDRPSSTGQRGLELQSHLDSCQQCRAEFQQEKELRLSLGSLPVPPPSEDFVKRAFSVARARHQRRRVKQAIPYWGGALAACLAIWLMVVGSFQQPTTPVEPSQQAIAIRMNEQRLVQVIVNAPRDLAKADVVIELPPQIELAGFPGRREIRWNTNLKKGKNLLSLPLIAKSEGRAELITHINHDNKSKMLSLVMDISHDELTQTGQYPPTTA